MPLMPIPVPSASPRASPLRIERKGDLFPGFLHRSPDRHLVDRRPEGRHERLRHAKGRQGAQKPQLPSNLQRDPLVGVQSQKRPANRDLCVAKRALDLHLPKRDPRIGRQNLHRLSCTGLPDESLVVPACWACEGFLLPRHHKLAVPDQRFLDEVRQNLRQKNRKRRQQGGKPDIRLAHRNLSGTVSIGTDEIALRKGHFYIIGFLDFIQANYVTVSSEIEKCRKSLLI